MKRRPGDRRLRALLLAAASSACVLHARPAAADDCPTRGQDIPFWSGYQLQEENDSIVTNGGDERYTQGLRVTVNGHPDATPRWLCGMQNWLGKRLWPPAEEYRKGFAVFLGQNLYTPRIITSRTIDANDRSFTDYNYLGGRISLTSDDQSHRHLLEATIGILGSPSLARGTQGGLHAMRLHRIPKGWDMTAPNTLGVNAYYRLELRRSARPIREDHHWLDLTLGPAVELGNVRTAAAAHAALRLGWNLSGFPTMAIPVAGAGDGAHTVEFGGIAGAEGRVIPYTSLVRLTEGSQGSIDHAVADLRYGFFARVGSFRATWMRVHRSPEFTVQGAERRSQDFASIAFSYEPPATLSPKPRPWILKDWQLELGMGAPFGGPETDPSSGRGIASQFAFRKGLTKWGLYLGLLELSAATVEGAPTPGEPGNRSDIFLRQRAVTLGWTWPLNGGRGGRIGLRAGTAVWGGNARIETVYHQPENGQTGEQLADSDFQAPRGGWLAGAQYFAPLESHLSLGVDVTYHDVKLGEPVPGLETHDFVSAIVAVQVRP